MTTFISILIIWVLCGVVGVMIDNIRPRTQFEAPIPLIGGGLCGLATLLFVLGVLWSNSNNQERNEP